MGVRPPPNDDSEPECIEFGIAALDARLERADLEFPADRETVEAALGDAEIPYDAAGNTLPVAEAIEQTGVTRFDSEQDLLNSLHPVFEDVRRSRSSGLLSQLRGLTPF